MRCSSVDAGRSQRQARAGVSSTGFHTPILLRQTLICTYPECSSEKHILLASRGGRGRVVGRYCCRLRSSTPSVICSPSPQLPPCASAHSFLAFAPGTLLKQQLYYQRSKLPKCPLFSPASLPVYSVQSFATQVSRHRQQGPQPGAGRKRRIQDVPVPQNPTAPQAR